MTSTSVPRLRVKLPPPPAPPPRLLQMHQQPSVLILIGSVVPLHTVCSLILPLRPQRRARIRLSYRQQYKHTHLEAAQTRQAAHQNDLVHVCSGHPVQERPCKDATVHTGSKSRTTSAQVAGSQTVTILPPWVYCSTPSHYHAKLFSAFW